MEPEQCISCGEFTIDESDGLCRNLNCPDIRANLDKKEDEEFLN